MTDQKALRDSLHEATEWLDTHPDFILGAIYKNFEKIELVSYAYDNNKEGIKQALFDSRTTGIKFDKEYTGDYLNLKLELSKNLVVRVPFDRDEVCERRVVGTRTVEREIATGWRKENVEEDIVEWDCPPLLSMQNSQ